MKILTIVGNLNKGGTQRAGQNFAEGYQVLGHDSRILSLYGLGYRYEEIKDKIPFFSGINIPVLNLISYWKPDIIHIHSHGPKKAEILSLINYLDSHGIYPKVLEQNVFSNPSPWEHKLCISFQLSSWCQWLYEKRGGDISKSAILPYAVITNNFSPAPKVEVNTFKSQHGIPSDAFVIGRIGQSIGTKWCRTIFDVFEGVSKQNPKVYLLLVGVPPRILKLFEKSNFKNNIVTIDVIHGDKNLSVAYSCMDVLYHAAEQGESFGYVIVESILCGTPVISLSTPWGDNSQIEVVNNGTGGYVVHRHNSAIEIINRMVCGDLKYDAQKGIDFIKREFDYLNVCEKAIAISKNRIENKKISIRQIWDILNKSYDKPRRLDISLLRFRLRQIIRITSGYNTIKIFLSKIIKKIKAA